MDQLSNLVESPILKLSVPLGLLGGIALILFVWWRAGSIHVVLERIWKLIAGKTEVHDAAAKSMLQDFYDLERVRYALRLRIDSITELHKLKKWQKDHSVGPYTLMRVRPWLDLSLPNPLRKPPAIRFWVAILWILLPAGILFAANQLTQSHFALLKTHGSKNWFLSDASVTKSVLADWSFTVSDCTADQTNITSEAGFQPDETAAICNAMRNDSLKPIVQQAIGFQKWLGVIISLVAVSMIIAAATAIRAADAATRLCRRLESGNASEAAS